MRLSSIDHYVHGNLFQETCRRAECTLFGFSEKELRSVPPYCFVGKQNGLMGKVLLIGLLIFTQRVSLSDVKSETRL